MNNYYSEMKTRLLADDRCLISNNPTPIMKLHVLGMNFKWIVVGLNPFNENEMIALSNYFDESRKFAHPELTKISFNQLERIERTKKWTIVEDLDFQGNFAIGTYSRATRIHHEIVEDKNILERLEANPSKELFSIKWNKFKP